MPWAGEGGERKSRKLNFLSWFYFIFHRFRYRQQFFHSFPGKRINPSRSSVLFPAFISLHICEAINSFPFSASMKITFCTKEHKDGKSLKFEEKKRKTLFPFRRWKLFLKDRSQRRKTKFFFKTWFDFLFVKYRFLDRKKKLKFASLSLAHTMQCIEPRFFLPPFHIRTLWSDLHHGKWGNAQKLLQEEEDVSITMGKYGPKDRLSFLYA